MIGIQICLTSGPIFEYVGNSQPFQAQGLSFHCQISETSYVMADVLCFYFYLFIIILKYFYFLRAVLGL